MEFYDLLAAQTAVQTDNKTKTESIHQWAAVNTHIDCVEFYLGNTE